MAPDHGPAEGPLRGHAGIGIVLLLALVLFGWGIHWGLPWGWDFDELSPRFVSAARASDVARGWPRKYPPMHFYLVAPLHALSDRVALAVGASGDADSVQARRFLVSRGLSLVLGLGVLLCTYLFSLRLVGRLGACFAALIVALFLPMVFYSKLANLDVPYLFWFSLSVVYYLRVLENTRLADFVLFAVAATLAVATKDQAYGLYVLAPLAILPPLVRARRREGRRAPWIGLLGDPRVLAALVAAVALFLVVHGAFVRPWQFPAHVRHITGPASADYRQFDHTLSGHWQMLGLSLRDARFGFGWPLLGACLLGIVVVLASAPRPERPLFAGLLVMAGSYYLCFLSVILFQYDRFQLPFAVLLAPFGGLVLSRLASAAWLPSALRVSVLGGILVHGTARAVELDWRMVHDTRYAMERRVRTHGGGERAAGPGSQQMLPRNVRAVSWNTILRRGPGFLDALGARWLVVNVTALWREPWAEFHRSLLERRTPFARRERVPRGRLLGLLDCEGVASSLCVVSPELELFERLRGSWADEHLEQARGERQDLLRLAAEERERGRYEDACRLDEAARALDPRDARAALGLGLDAEGLERPGEAESWFHEALRLDPDWPAARIAVERMEAGAAGTGAARAAMEGVRGAFPEPGDAELVAARLAVRGGRRREAWRLLELAQEGFVHEADAARLALVARSWQELGARARAARAWRAALRIAPHAGTRSGAGRKAGAGGA